MNPYTVAMDIDVNSNKRGINLPVDPSERFFKLGFIAFPIPINKGISTNNCGLIYASIMAISYHKHATKYGDAKIQDPFNKGSKE